MKAMTKLLKLREPNPFVAGNTLWCGQKYKTAKLITCVYSIKQNSSGIFSGYSEAILYQRLLFNVQRTNDHINIIITITRSKRVK